MRLTEIVARQSRPSTTCEPTFKSGKQGIGYILMKSRNRSKVTHVLKGVVYTYDHGYYEELGTGYSDVVEEECFDYYEKKVRKDSSLPPSDCVISKHYRDPLCMNRATGTFRFNNHPVTNQGTTTVAGLNNVRPAPGTPARVSENSALAFELLAATNPFRSEFSTPVAIRELVDVSTLFRLAAKGFAQYVGSSYLNYKFGWVQFLRDVRTLHGVTTAIERRIREFQSLERKGGLRRKVHLKTTQADYSDPNRQVQSSWGTAIFVDVTGYWRCETSGTVRWRYREGYDLHLDKLQAFNLAVRQVFDLDELDPETVWNLIPFSWLVDYFVGMTAYLGASNTKGMVEPYDICIVRCSVSRFKQKVRTKPSSISMTGTGNVSRDHYERDVVSPSSLAYPSVSLLSWEQTLIVAALFASFKK